MQRLGARLPFYYGWVVVAVAFVTMGLGVNSRTAFSLLFPPILEEFGWERGVTAGAFSAGFVASVVLSPAAGWLVDRWGPRISVPLGAVLVALGLTLSTYARTPLELYLTLGVLVVGGSIFISYIGHSTFLPNWFVKRRGLAIGIAFSGVGVGATFLFPWVQYTIGTVGWRGACWSLALVLVAVVVPLNLLLQRRRPEDLGLPVDGHSKLPVSQRPSPTSNVVDSAWASVEWTLGRAMRTGRYWWLALGYFSALYAWYAVQVHQTKFLIDHAFSPEQAAFALSLVGITAIAGQIAVGHLSDRVGREWGWTVACGGFAACYALLVAISHAPQLWMVYAMATAQGLLGYGLAPLFSSIGAELFQGARYGVIFGSISVWSGLGAGFGPWATGALFDRSGSYQLAFTVAAAVALSSIACIWAAGPRKVRAVSGRVRLIPPVPPAPAAGPVALLAVGIAPTPLRLRPGESRRLRAQAFGPGAAPLESGVTYSWQLDAGAATLAPDPADPQAVTVTAGARSGIIRARARRGDELRVAERALLVGPGPGALD